MKKIIFDTSWDGMGGICRFSSEISKRLVSCSVDKLTSKPTSLFASFKLSFLMTVNKADLYVLPGYIPPFFSVSNYVFTIHDLNHIDRDENSSFLKRLFYNFVIKPGCFSARYVLTVSEFSRKRIIEWSGVSPEKVINVGNGVDDSFHLAVQPYLPGYSYLLCVSNRKLHKNEPRIIRAFSSANISESIKLVMTGYPSEELSTLINEYQLSERVVFIGKVQEERLPSLYKGSLCLVFPSLYEGFGMPIIEANATGRVLLTSKITSIPEIAANTAHYINPYDVSSIRKGFQKLISDDKYREKLILRGIANAKRFTIKHITEEYENIYNS